MPEGPEMYRMAQQIRAAVAAQPLTEVWFARADLQQHAAMLQAQTLRHVSTVGKALLLQFSNGACVYTHNQLYGRWLFSKPHSRPDTRRQLRLAVSTATRSALLYSASTIELIQTDDLPQHPFIRRAGLDVLSTEASQSEIAGWLSRPQFARRRLGLMLLDQGFIAGVGNYLRSEILFKAGLHHHRRLCDLDSTARHRLAAAIHLLFWRSVQTAGITNDAERVQQLKQACWRRRDYRHYVFGRDGQACFLCDSPISKTLVSGRRLYHCTQCQPGALP